MEQGSSFKRERHSSTSTQSIATAYSCCEPLPSSAESQMVALSTRERYTVVVVVWFGSVAARKGDALCTVLKFTVVLVQAYTHTRNIQRVLIQMLSDINEMARRTVPVESLDSILPRKKFFTAWHFATPCGVGCHRRTTPYPIPQVIILSN